MLSEVPFVLHPQLQLLLFNLVLLRLQDALHSNQIMVVFKDVVIGGTALVAVVLLLLNSVLLFTLGS